MNQTGDAVLEELKVRKVRENWAFGRDIGEWDLLASCFHPEATVTVSWYSGPAAGFIERSKQSRAAMKPEERNKHWLGNMRARVNGTRAVLETDAQVLVREAIDGHWFDYTCWMRFFDLMVKHEGAWKIYRMKCIYDKDRLDPLVPGSVPPSFFAAVPVSGPESGFAYMRFRQEKRGRTVPEGIVLGGSAGEQALRQEAEQWLSGRMEGPR